MKITMAQLNYTVGDIVGNTNKIMKVIEDNYRTSDIIVFSELALVGYPPLDLIERPGFLEQQNFYLNQIAKTTEFEDFAIVIGIFEKNNSGVGKPFYNSLAFCYNGKVQYIYRKILLPTFNIFDEDRYFEPGKLVGFHKYKGKKIGFLICEDAWNTSQTLYSFDPVSELFKYSPDFVISINASPSEVNKQVKRYKIFSNISKKYNATIFYCNQVGTNDDISFDGSSFLVENGKLTYVCDSFFEETVTINPENKVNLLDRKETRSDFDIKYEFIYNQLLQGIRDYIYKCGFKKAVVASSGGVDSALVLALAVEAIGKENVVAITMPSEISSTGSVTDSETLCNNLGIKLYSYPIKDNLKMLVSGFKDSFDGLNKSVTKENMQARIRGMILMAFSNEFNYIALGTGNKSEFAVGYCTLGGDMMNVLSVIGDLYKTEVWDLCRYINKRNNKEIIPEVIINKEPSAELYEGQKDTNQLPPYELLDAILIKTIERENIDWKTLDECNEIIKKYKFNDFNKIYSMIDKSEFKRRMAAPTIRVHSVAWGAGRRIPIVQKFNNI
jgi:NAD+ synthetase